MSFQYFDELDGDSKRRYTEKLELVGLEECPYRIPSDAWINNPKKWPDIEWPDVCDYLIDTPGIYTKEAMKNRRSLEAHNQFTSGWVGSVLFVKTTSKNFVMKAEVMPSQRVNDEKHSPWVALGPEGEIICAHCNCMAGLGESCSHIASILFKLEAAVRKGYTAEACTEKACSWNDDFVKKVKPKRIVDIQFYKTALKPMKSRRVQFKEATDMEKEDFLGRLKDLPREEQPVGLSLFNGYADSFHHTAAVPLTCKLPPTLRTYFVPNIQDEDIPAKVNSLMGLEFTDQQRNYVNESSKLQHMSLVWREMRVGRITASVAHDVLHTDIDSPSLTVMKKLCCVSPRSDANVPSMKWGREKEKTAVETYINLVKDRHENLAARQSGLQLSAEHHFLAASADAIAHCDCHGDWLIEVKCPYKHKDAQSAEDIFNDKDYCVSSDRQLKTGHRYMTQIQMQMYVYNLSTCHFVIWTPRVCFGTVVSYNASFSNNVDSLVHFYRRHVAPELITRQIESDANLSHQPTEASETEVLYCYCRQPENENEEMIGCDNDRCVYKWVHFTCAGIKRPPKGAWYCKYCRKNKKKKTSDM